MAMAAAQLSAGEKYDVFLSFRGPDTRDRFLSCLFVFLEAAGLRVFMDDEELRVGESITGSIERAIYDSKLFVPIFSKGYASSKWCLKEIAWMVDCMDEFPGKKEMLPVFYDVDASDVKLKTDRYTEPLLEHEKTFCRKTVERWRKALVKVPEVKGWNRTDAKGEGELIRRITEDICRRLKLKHRILPDHFIGMEDQVQDIIHALDCGSREDVRILVIHGMGGIGKTTLVSAVFNKICWQFQGCSFLSNVRESTGGNGIINLQNKLLGDILKFSSPIFCDMNDAMNCIQGWLRNKNVLVVLDDVSDIEQIKKLVGMGDWVGLGSRVIVTTRNLNCVANVEKIVNNVTILQGEKIYIYEMRELGFDNSLQLLCLHAFGQYAPPHGYEQLSRDILSFTRGIPLAIEVIGSYLGGKREAIWKEMLNKLKKVPHDRLYREILMSTYEALCDEEKEIFLDIAFFFSGCEKTSAFYYWEACNLFPEMSVDTLISLALVKIVCHNKLWMHDLLRDLGREVVHKQSNGNLGRYNRLCNDDAKRLLSKRLGTRYVKALKLDSTHAHNFTPVELSGISDLQFLELYGGNFIGEFEVGCLSELRWLSWRDCALDFRGTNFYLENLVVLRLSDSENITESWSGWEQFKTARNLKVLELQDLDLTAIPDLSSFLSLERLVVDQFTSHVQINPSIGNLEFLNSLEIINYIGWPPNLNQDSQEGIQLPSSICKLKALSRLIIQGFKMKQLPENIGEMKGLKVMEITRCELLLNLPDSIGDLESLCELVLSGDGIIELPESIGKLKKLTALIVSNNQLRRLPVTIGDLDRLEMLDASDNYDLQGEIPGEFGKLQSLKSLDLSETGICGIPSSIGHLSRLERLNLRYCPQSQELPDLSTCLTDLDNSSPTKLQKSQDLTVDMSLMPPYSSTEFVHIDPLINNLECLNSQEMINRPWYPADTNPGKSRHKVLHLPSSICNLKSLSMLVLNCIKLNQLPENIGELKGLKVMEITECEFLQNLPDSIGDLESLCQLCLSGDGITELPESIGKLGNLTVLNVRNNRLRRLPTTIGDLDRLEVLDASDNRDLQGEIPGEFGSLQSLKSLDLSDTGICGIPSSIVHLSRLEDLILLRCDEIQELPVLPPSLTLLQIKSRSLKAVPDLSSLTTLVHLRLLNHDNDGHPWDDPQVHARNITAWIPHLQKQETLTVDLSPMPPFLSAGLDHLSRLMGFHLPCPNLSVVSLPPGLMSLSLHPSTSLSCWEHHSNLEGLSRLSLYKSIASEIRLDDLESLKNLTFLEIEGCDFLERVHDVSRLQKLRDLRFYKCQKLVEIGGLAQPPDSFRVLEIRRCDSIQRLPHLFDDTESPSELHLIVEKCRKLLDFKGPYESYFQGGELHLSPSEA